MTTAKSASGASQEKRARVVTATVTYPYHPIELCIELAKAVREIGNGRAEVTKSQLAHRLGVSEQSSDFAQKIASTKTYGLIDGRTTLQLTETSRQYFFPTEDGEEYKKRCLFRFFESPGLFKELINTYDGSRPPSVPTISNLIGEKFGIPESWKSRVATYFIRSSQFIGAMGTDGFLRYKAQLDGHGLNGNSPAPAVNASTAELPERSSTPAPASAAQTKQNQEGVIVWTYPCAGKFLRIETPENMTPEVWEKLNKYIQVLQP